MTEADIVESIVAWLRSPDMDGQCHTHTIAKELARGDWQAWRDLRDDDEPTDLEPRLDAALSECATGQEKKT